MRNTDQISEGIPAMTDKIAGDSGPEQAWAIMAPVKGRIRVAMAFGAASGLAVLATMVCLAMVVLMLRDRPGEWPWGWMLGALAGVVASYLARLGAFNQSHYAAFRLERILRSDLAERLAEVPLGYVQAQGAGALTKVIHDDVKALHVFVADSTPLYARAYVTPLVTLALLLWLDWRWRFWRFWAAVSRSCAGRRRGAGRWRSFTMMHAKRSVPPLSSSCRRCRSCGCSTRAMPASAAISGRLMPIGGCWNAGIANPATRSG